jgi:uncharacterized protein (TIGR03118 family)
MMKSADRSQFVRNLTVLALVLVALCASSFAQDSVQQFTQTNLVSNLATGATFQDADLKNAWGISQAGGSPFWISDNDTGVSTLYNGAGVKQGLTVTIPTGNASVNPLGSPTGTIFNGSTFDFLLAAGAPAKFLFVTYDGTISGWNPAVDATNAVIEVNQSGQSVFTGAAVAQLNQWGTSTTYLYVADIKQGRIEVFDTSFKPVTLPWGRFHDEWLWGGYVPYNIWNIGGNLYVAYAKANSQHDSVVTGSGLGFVDVFSPSGHLLHRLEHGPWFNAPWGLAVASSNFGLYSHDVLVGQFGSGEILVFDPVTGQFKGKLLDSTNNPLTISGLWALTFCTGGTGCVANALYFSAGPNGQADGLFGTIAPVQDIEGNDQ